MKINTIYSKNHIIMALLYRLRRKSTTVMLNNVQHIGADVAPESKDCVPSQKEKARNLAVPGLFAY